MFEDVFNYEQLIIRALHLAKMRLVKHGKSKFELESNIHFPSLKAFPPSLRLSQTFTSYLQWPSHS